MQTLLNPFPAAFRRLCVETVFLILVWAKPFPAAFRRLCVETPDERVEPDYTDPAAFRRLCVETSSIPVNALSDFASRLQAAVC